MENSIWIATLAAAITAGTPILYAALGEILAERAGVLNLGVEGMMLVGAVTGFMVAVRTGNPWMGFLVALLAAGLLAAIFAFLTITLRANQVVTGLALTMFGTGLSGFLGKPYVGIPLPLSFKPVAIPFLANIPLIGPVLFRHDPLVYLTYVLVPLLWYYFYRTRPGLNLRAVGENPAAADALGVNVFALRYIYVIIGGMLAGAGGAFLSLAYAPSWLENMTAGRGWIAVALVIFAVWDPVKALLGSYLFGGVDALTYTLQAATKIAIPSFFLKMLPYILTLVVLIIATRQTLVKHIGAPGALSIPYDREER
ncbi:Branched-chain amino acid transport system / permease component [Neomoorella glycerini]|uniref:Branched-chain amino acid transport system / permease component n=1 Tax=Neomoorella glycerini TaxID=55779 RepID=A0A6I5ZNH4_9FIRM|nr:ABC transporter permease [Moorella glycerini]QGP91179.1 Branched-chain amino acid transport system / permease component [Moorella glycerini]